MPLRPLAIVGAISTILTGTASAEDATMSDLGAAFQATFGQPAPVTRRIEQPIYDTDQHKVVGHDSLEMEFWPDRLVAVDGNHSALIIKEYALNAGHITQGAIAVSYLNYSDRGWTLEHLWLEVAYSGVFGEPANVGEEARWFGSARLYLATGEWCGMGACSDTISVISLAPSGPAYLGVVIGGGQFTADPQIFSDPDDVSCEDYVYTAVVGPPISGSGVFSVTYDGWTAPPKARTTKSRFHLVADAVPDGNGLTLKPEIPLPDCGR